MEYIVGREKIQFNNTSITLGKFDGIHIGHQKLIKEITNKKNNEITKSVLFTFEQLPQREYIYTEREKKDIVSNLGIDIMIVYPFDETTRNMDAKIFVEEILVKQLGVRRIVVGKDFRFGKDRLGDADLLKELATYYNYEIIVCTKEHDSDQKEVSSTLIREYITNAKMNKVCECLGRNYSVSGTIIKGNQIGRTLGFPTINIIPDKEKIMPLNGVYESEIILEENQQDESQSELRAKYVGLTNVGNKPTISKDLEKNIETYIFNFEKEVYGYKATVYLNEFIRPEMKFNNLEELKNRLSNDKESYLNKKR